MVDVALFLHYVNLSMYVYMMGYYGYLWWFVGTCRCIPIIRRLIRVNTVAAMLLGSTFLTLQIDWLIKDQNANVGEVVGYQWLIYDYLMVVWMLSVAVCAHVYCKWIHAYTIRKTRRCPVGNTR